METTAERAHASEGFLLLDSSMSPLFVNPTAAQILTYPQNVRAQKDLGNSVARKMSSMFRSDQFSAEAHSLAATYQSGKRLYFCRAFQVNALAEGNSQRSVVVLLERGSETSAPIMEVLEAFHLTPRERDVFRYLLQGLTSKEVAVQMGISANTVKAFLRLIMVKMGVSTRSGILGKVLTMPPHR